MKKKEVERYLLKNNHYENVIYGKNGEPWHNQRYIESLSWIDKYMKNSLSVLELGGKSIFPIYSKPFMILR